MVSRMLRGVFNSRPPQPCLSMKLITLLALSRLCWSADLAGFQLSSLKLMPEGATFMASHLAKHSRPGRSLKEFFFPSLPENPTICQEYILRTKQFREGKVMITRIVCLSLPREDIALLRVVLSPDGLSQPLTRAGVDTSIFKAHSVRGASTTAAALAGIYQKSWKQGIGHHNHFLKGSIIDLTHRRLVRWYYLWLLTCKVEM